MEGATASLRCFVSHLSFYGNNMPLCVLLVLIQCLVTSWTSKCGFSDESAVYFTFDYCGFDLYDLLYGAESILSQMQIISYIKKTLIASKGSMSYIKGNLP
jgi:hypothetical protein